MKKITKRLIVGIIFVLIVVGGVMAYPDVQAYRYNKAITKADSLNHSGGNFKEALKLYKKALSIKNSNDIKTKAEYIEKSLNDSQYNFNRGIACFNNKTYVESYNAFKLVIKEDLDNYKKATEKMTECVKLNGNYSIQMAKDYAKDEDYGNAKRCISDALTLEPNNQQLKVAFENYKNLGEAKYAKAQAEIKAKQEETKAKAEAEAKAKIEAEAKAKAEAKQHGVKIGMTQQQVLDSNWGAPEEKNRTTNSFGVYEQWVYGGGNYLYFENGILKTIQN